MTYSSIAALCKAEKIDRKIITAASKLGLPGFNSNRTVNFDLLAPALKEHATELESLAKEKKSKEQLVLEGKALDNDIKRLTKKKLEGTYIDPEEWYQWHSDFGTKLSTALKTARKNLMAKCVGYESVVDTEFLDLFILIQKEVETCKQPL